MTLVIRTTTNRICFAEDFAREHHRGQVRKYTGDPYIVHPISVANMVGVHDGDENMIIAALLHDLWEDCDVSFSTIAEEFGSDVMGLVFWLSSASKVAGLDMNRATRKAFDASILAGASERAKIIKCADLIDNTDSICRHDPTFAKVYLKEKADLLKVMVVDHPLWFEANNLVKRWTHSLAASAASVPAK
jgi:(p)ppGpp synthase/HD superfamily hydrolase